VIIASSGSATVIDRRYIKAGLAFSLGFEYDNRMRRHL
jgi:hypothetical protein